MKLFFTALVLVLAVGIVTPLQAQDTPSNLVIEIQRTATAGQYGVVRIIDQFSVYNNGTTLVSSLDYGFAQMYRKNVYYMSAADSTGKRLSLNTDVNKTSQFFWIRAQFPEPLAFNKTFNFTVTTMVAGLIRGVAAGFEFNFTAAPVLAQDAKFANVTFLAVPASNFRLPTNTSYIIGTVNNLPALTQEYRPWKAYSNETFYAPYATVNQFILDIRQVDRDVIIDSNGGLSVKESYWLFNPSITISSLTVTLPEGATNVMAYDRLGAMWGAPQDPSPPYQVTISPRYSLGIRANESFRFTVTYDLPQSKYLKQLSWWGSYNLTFTLLNNKDDFLYDNATVRIIAPDGVTISNLKTEPQSPLSYPIGVDEKDRTFKLQGVTNQDNLTTGLTFTYPPFWAGLDLIPWAVGLEIAILAFAIGIKVRRGPEVAVPVPVEKLREFVSLYDERLTLSRDLVAMEEEVSRGGLLKHEFRRRRKAVELRLDELNKSLMGVKVELRAIGPRYDELIRRIDRAEAEIEASRASMNQVRSQYRAGKTTRETYDTLVNDIAKRIDRAEETVETILITLREEAR